MSAFIKPFYHNKEYRIVEYIPYKDAGGVAGFSVKGDDLSVVAATIASVLDSNGLRTKLETPAFSQSDAGIQGSQIYTRQLRSELYCRFKLTQISLVRAFIGFTDKDLPSMVDIDNVSGNYFGLSFSSSRDSNFKMITENGGSSPTVTDTGIPVDTNVHELYLQMINFPTQVQWQIDDSDRGVIDTNILGSGVQTRLVAGVETQAAAVKGIELGKILGISDH